MFVNLAKDEVSNKMDTIKELVLSGEGRQGEIFKFKGGDSRYCFIGGTLKYEDTTFSPKEWRRSSWTLNDLLCWEIIREPWKPKLHERFYYWFINSTNKVVASGTSFNGLTYDILQVELGNCYRTQEEAYADTKMRDHFEALVKKYLLSDGVQQ